MFVGSTMRTKFWRNTNFCCGLPEFKKLISVHDDLSQNGEELQSAVQLVQLAVHVVLFRQLAIALQLFLYFIRLSHHFGNI